MAKRYQDTTALEEAQILDAARKIVAESGSEHATVANIARELGIFETAIYPHFKGKKEILSLLIDHFEDSLADGIERASADSHASPLEVLKNALRNHLSAIKQGRDVSFQIVSEAVSLGNKELNAKTVHVIDKYEKGIEHLLTEGVKSGDVWEDIDLEAAATCLFCLIQGLVNLRVLSNNSFDLGEKFEPLWHLFSNTVIK